MLPYNASTREHIEASKASAAWDRAQTARQEMHISQQRLALERDALEARRVGQWQEAAIRLAAAGVQDPVKLAAEIMQSAALEASKCRCSPMNPFSFTSCMGTGRKWCNACGGLR